MKIKLRFLFLFTLILPICCYSLIQVGVGQTEITPPIGTPSAGYTDRRGEGMKGIHDPLLAQAVFIDNGDKKIVLCSVDNLGFTSDMVLAIEEIVHRSQGLHDVEIYIASSHTHSGGGSFLNIPIIGESLAGKFNAEISQLYIDKTACAIIKATQHPFRAKLGIGYGHAEDLSFYRGLWPEGEQPLSDVALIKVTSLDDKPIAAIFNYPVHPTVLQSENRLFSADFVGCTRNHLRALLGSDIVPIFINGAQGDILPKIFDAKDRFASCDQLGKSLAETVEKIWLNTETSQECTIVTKKLAYTLVAQATPFGITLPVENYRSEMNLIVFSLLNRSHAFLTIPGELSCIYDKRLKVYGKSLGYFAVSFFGLTNDAHGYIILPESWRHKTFESQTSFGGENYGELTESRAKNLLRSGV